MKDYDLDRRSFMQLSTAMLVGASNIGVEKAEAKTPDLNISKNKKVPYKRLEVIATEHPEAKKYIPLVMEAAEKHKKVFGSSDIFTEASF